MLNKLKKNIMMMVLVVVVLFSTSMSFGIDIDGEYYIEQLPHKSATNVTYEQKCGLLGKKLTDVKTLLGNTNAATLTVFDELKGRKYGMILDSNSNTVVDILIDSKNTIDGVQCYAEQFITPDDVYYFEETLNEWEALKAIASKKAEYNEYESGIVETGFGGYTMSYSCSYMENGEYIMNELSIFQDTDGNMYFTATQGIYLNKNAYINRPVG